MKNFKYKHAFYFVPMLIFLLFASKLIHANEISPQDVEKAVTNWVRYVTADARKDATVIKLETYHLDSTYFAYIAHLDQTGFCLCGADDLVLPVYLYSPEGIYDPANPSYQYILRDIAERQKYYTEGIDRGDPEVMQCRDIFEKRKQDWVDLISGNVQRVKRPPTDNRSEPDSLKLDFKNKWNQQSPYKDSCPQFIEGFPPAVVGCVATSMSQAMYYWKWPYTGTGSHTTHYHVLWRNDWDEEPLSTNPNIPNWGIWTGRLEWIPDNGGLLRMKGRWDHSMYLEARDIDPDNQEYIDALTALRYRLNIETHNCTANFSNTNYDWSVLHEDHNDPPNVGDEEVAQLCYHAGIGVGMGYGIYGSACGQQSIEDALENYFRYDSDAIYINADKNLMTEDLNWLRIICFAGGPHAWIVYGYNKSTDPNRQFLMDLGWGYPDEWYTLDGCPYPSNITIISMIAPNNVKFVGNTILGDGSPDNPFFNIEYALSQVQDNSTLIFKAGTENVFYSANLEINQPVTLKGYNVTIKK